MFFILAFGAASVYGAGRFLRRGEPGVEMFSVWMIRTTGLSAAFGFFTGMIKVASFIDAYAKSLDERVQFLIQGTGESLNNLSLGLLLVTLSCLLIAVGHRRFPASR
jgi:hypothetical protein